MKSKQLPHFLVFALIGLVWTPLINAEVTLTPIGTTFVHQDEDEDILESTLSLTNNGDEEASFFIRIRPDIWGEQNGRDARGGPDEMDYEWRDNDEDDCPPYQWIDITEFEDVYNVSENEEVLDDSFHGMYELGFEFEFYGEIYEEIGLYTNGWASFVDAAAIGFFYPQWCQGDLPNADNNPATHPTLLAVNYQDLDPAVSGTIYYWTNEQDMAVITWEDVSHYVDREGNQDKWTFQVVITANGLIKYQFASVGIYDNSDMHIGLQNEARDLGFTVVRQDFDYIEEERIIAFGQPAAWVSWLTYEPGEAVIQPNGGVEEITITVDCEDLAEGVYSASLIINVELEDHPPLLFPVILSVDTPVGAIEGTVTDEAGGAPVENATIIISPSEITLFSDEDGWFEMDGFPVGNYSLTCIHPDFFQLTLDEIEVSEDEATDASVGLLHAECNIDDEIVEVSIETDFETTAEFEATNDGNATLTYAVERHLLGDLDFDPWEIREEFAIGEGLEDTYLCGVVYIDDLYYVCGGNSAEQADGGPNLVYVLDENGNEVDRFPQFGESRYGMRDLDWDGEWLWGGDGSTVYGFTPDGDLQVEFETNISPNRAIAWDPEQNILWVAAENTDIFGYDRQGNEVSVIEKQDAISIRGLSYYPDDPDGFTLYIFSTDLGDDEDGSNTRVYKLNPDDGEIRFVYDLNLEGNRAGGLYISNQYDFYSWVFVSILENAGQTPDALVIWQIEARLDWMEVAPSEGEIEPGEAQLFELTFNSFGFPIADFEGELVFVHDGTNRETHLPVTMSVTQGEVHTFRYLDLNFGWNLVSLNIVPDDSNVVNIVAPLVEAGELLIMKNGAGQFYVPQDDFNNIPGWFVEEGYNMRMTQDTRLRVDGMSVFADDPIALSAGWNTISYFPRRRVDPILALSELVENDHLLIVKDGAGHFYVPIHNFSNMATMSEGFGYKVRVDEDVEFSYVTEAPEGLPPNGSMHYQVSSNPELIPAIPSTGINMSLLVFDKSGSSGEIGVYAGDLLVGSGVLQDGMVGIAVWGDDPTTTAIDGAVADQALEIRFVNEFGSQSISHTSIAGSANYQTDGFWAIELDQTETVVPESFGLVSVYPNPFNSQSRISYNLLESGHVDLSLFDISGRLVNNLVNGNREVGLNSATLNGNSLSSGVYIVKLKSEGKIAQQKVILIK